MPGRRFTRMLKTLINQHLGRYLIKDLLGRGGMAAVYRAADTALQRLSLIHISEPTRPY